MMNSPDLGLSATALYQKGKSSPGLKRPVAVLFQRFGPYHNARLAAAAQRLPICGIELVTKDLTYAWVPEPAATEYSQRTVFPGRVGKPVGCRMVGPIIRVMEAVRPAVLVLPGWQASETLICLAWAARLGVPVVLMADSQEVDKDRHWIGERTKRFIVGCYDAALVGGRSNVRYLERLGFHGRAISCGFDVVDNAYFSCRAQAAREPSVRQCCLGLPPHYMLTVARFVPEKNLARLIDSYRLYVKQTSHPWNLVLVGDGPQMSALQAQVRKAGLQGLVSFPGFRQYSELPEYYAHASAFVLPSLSEPWGLVVNEAMACGLPVAVSTRCGCAPELVEPGGNGYIFDPEDINAIAAVMTTLTSRSDAELQAMGHRSQDIISRWTPDTFAAGLEEAVAAAITHRGQRNPKRGSLATQALLLSLALPR